VPNEVIKNWVVSNYSKLLDESLNDLRLNGYSLGWEIGQPEIVQRASISHTPANLSDSTAGTAVARAVSERQSDAIIDNVGHCPHLSAPGVSQAAMNDFLATLGF